MPAQRFDLIASIPGLEPTGGSSVTNLPTVDITIYRCTSVEERKPPPYTAPGITMQVIAEFQWKYDEDGDGTATDSEVFGFNDGDIVITFENDAAIEDQIQLGYIAPVNVIVGPLGGGGNGTYSMPLTLNPNSAGTVYVTVLPRSAYVQVGEGADAENAHGPLSPVTISFNYSSLSGTEATSTKPEVNIIVPNSPVFNNATAPITLLWNSDIQQNMTRTIGADDDDDIKITNGTIEMSNGEPDFTHTGRTMTFNITLSGEGECTIRVKQDSETDTGGDKGPPEDTSESFLFDTGLIIPGTDTSDTGITTIYDSGSISFTNTSQTFFDGQKGAFKGISDLKLINNHFYGIAQIQHITGSNKLDQGKPARAVLFRIQNQTSGTSHSLKEYDSITDSTRSLITIGNNIFGFEGSHVADGLGNLIEFPNTVTTPSNIQDRGIPWRSRLVNPNATIREDNVTYSRHIRMSSPMVTVGNDLYLNPGYGTIRSIKSTDWESSQVTEGLDAPETRIDNWTLLKYGSNIDFRPPVVQTNEQTGYDVIQNLAELTFCYLGFDGNKFIFRPKFQPTARTTEDITTTTVFTPTNLLEVERQTMEFPSSGFLKINSEIFEYSSITGNNFTITGRNRFGTEKENHCEESIVGYINHIIDMEESSYQVRPINTLDMRQDLQQLYNIIKISYGDESLDREEVARNIDSINQNKPRELELSIPLTHHDTEWITWLSKQYLNFYSRVRYLLEVQLQPSFFIKTGDFILLREPRNSLINNQVFQVLRTTHTIKPYVTSLQLRRISEGPI